MNIFQVYLLNWELRDENARKQCKGEGLFCGPFCQSATI